MSVSSENPFLATNLPCEILQRRNNEVVISQGKHELHPVKYYVIIIAYHFYTLLFHGVNTNKILFIKFSLIPIRLGSAKPRQKPTSIEVGIGNA